MQADLTVVGGKASATTMRLKVPTVIGRSRETGLTIAHPMISRRHCEIYESGGLLMIRDLNSLNGTLIDGRRIKESPLPPNAEFTLGPLTFRVHYAYKGDLSKLPPTLFVDEPEASAITADLEPPATALLEPTPAEAPAETASDSSELDGILFEELPKAPSVEPEPVASAEEETPVEEEQGEEDEALADFLSALEDEAGSKLLEPEGVEEEAESELEEFEELEDFEEVLPEPAIEPIAPEELSQEVIEAVEETALEAPAEPPAEVPEVAGASEEASEIDFDLLQEPEAVPLPVEETEEAEETPKMDVEVVAEAPVIEEPETKEAEPIFDLVEETISEEIPVEPAATREEQKEQEEAVALEAADEPQVETPSPNEDWDVLKFFTETAENNTDDEIVETEPPLLEEPDVALENVEEGTTLEETDAALQLEELQLEEVPEGAFDLLDETAEEVEEPVAMEPEQDVAEEPEAELEFEPPEDFVTAEEPQVEWEAAEAEEPFADVPEEPFTEDVEEEPQEEPVEEAYYEDEATESETMVASEEDADVEEEEIELLEQEEAAQNIESGKKALGTMGDTMGRLADRRRSVKKSWLGSLFGGFGKKKSSAPPPHQNTPEPDEAGVEEEAMESLIEEEAPANEPADEEEVFFDEMGEESVEESAEEPKKNPDDPFDDLLKEFTRP